MTVWTLLYSPMDLGAFGITVVGLLLNAIRDFAASRLGRRREKAQDE